MREMPVSVLPLLGSTRIRLRAFKQGNFKKLNIKIISNFNNKPIYFKDPSFSFLYLGAEQLR